MKKITHLVFAGNALRTLCLCGILRYLYCYEMDKDIHNVAGTSMGAFFSLVFALKIPIEILENIIYDVCCNKNDFNNIDPSKIFNIINDLGITYSLDYLKKIKEYIKNTYNQDDMTFIELSKKNGINLFISATRINDGSNIIFNVNDTPNISIIDATAASMCIPIISKPILIDGYYYIDGFLTDNYPHKVFKGIHKDNILGVAVNIDTDYQINKIEKDTDINFLSYINNIIQIFYINTYKKAYKYKIEKLKDSLIINTSPIKSIFKTEIKNNKIELFLKKDDVNNLFLQGFKEVNDYINKKNYFNNSNLDLCFCDKSSIFQEI